ncbi:hypothetical protein DZC30_20050 [Comamonas testosteroni]|uniref:Uncharacterized protein n=1 Tax=Comamonas testosteroni TaxID=285 RepID=A0A373F8Y0_COMTE|nr:hypothetical protein DZC30_20050 [Comamonas testosteroni]
MPSHPTTQRSDENWVVTAVAVFLVGSVVLATAGYQYLKYSKQQEQSREERQTYERYNDYLQSTQEKAPAAQAPASSASTAASAPSQPATPAPTMAEKLLSHPNVTPGPGFNAPGVQETGVTIIDALDHAQATAKPQTP